jgi:hypothetical protein
VHPHRFLHGAVAGEAGVRLGLARAQRRFGVAGVQRGERPADDRARHLRFAEELGGAVPQRLEFADEAVELLAPLEVRDRALERLVGQPEQLRGRDRPADFERAFQPSGALLLRAHEGIARRAHGVEPHARRVVAVVGGAGAGPRGAVAPRAAGAARRGARRAGATSVEWFCVRMLDPR